MRRPPEQGHRPQHHCFQHKGLLNRSGDRCPPLKIHVLKSEREDGFDNKSLGKFMPPAFLLLSREVHPSDESATDIKHKQHP